MDILREVTPLFVTPIATARITGFNFQQYADAVLATLSAEQLSDLSKIGITPTYDDLHLRPAFKELVELIDGEAREFFESELGMSQDSLEMSCMWSNVQLDGCRHHAHIHPNSFYSGVLYLEIPPGEFVDPGVLFFVDPRPARLMQQADHNKFTVFTDRSYGFRPQTGLMLLFPSWLEHGTDVCKIGPGKRRISLSFNYTLTKASGPTMKLNFQQAV